MAKASGLTAIDKYVEKAVAIVCGLIFVYALFHWGFSSPMEFGNEGGKKIQPAEIDASLKSKADDVQKRIVNFRPTIVPVPDYIVALTTIGKNAAGDKYIQSFDSSNARTPLKEVAPTPKATITLAEVEAAVPAPLEKPSLKAVWVLPQKENATDVCVINGIVAYPYTDLIRQWNEKFHMSFNVIFLEQLVEIQEQNPDGSWGAIRLAKPQPRSSKNASGGVVARLELPVYDGKNAQDIQASLTSMMLDGYQQSILQPDYPDVYWSRPPQWISWRVHLPSSELSEGVVQAQGTLIEIAATTAPSTAVPVAANPVAPRRGVMPPPALPANPTSSPAQVANASLPVISAEPTYIKQRDEKGRLLAWFSDNSLEGGKTYRFRVRFKLVNPLLASDVQVKDQQDAMKPFIHTPWSQWSTPVAAPDFAQIFLSSVSMNTAQVTIFAKAFGQVVKQIVGVVPGDAIGHDEDVKVANPLTVKQDQKKVNFGTSCVVVAMNLDKQVFRNGALRKTSEMIYLDANGRLQSRLQDVDKDSKTYKELTDLSTPATGR